MSALATLATGAFAVAAAAALGAVFHTVFHGAVAAFALRAAGAGLAIAAATAFSAGTRAFARIAAGAGAGLVAAHARRRIFTSHFAALLTSRVQGRCSQKEGKAED